MIVWSRGRVPANVPTSGLGQPWSFLTVPWCCSKNYGARKRASFSRPLIYAPTGLPEAA